MSLILDALKKNEQRQVGAEARWGDGQSDAGSARASGPSRGWIIFWVAALAVANLFGWWWYGGGSAVVGQASPASATSAMKTMSSGATKPPGRSSFPVKTGIQTPTQTRTPSVADAPPHEVASESRHDAGRLPHMRFTSHVYSDNPQSAFVVINGVIAQVGDEVAPGVRLEAITPQGVVLSHGGKRIEWPALKDVP
jgi:hypothetical protein